MPNYQNGKIYKITAGNLTYYGSTTQPLSKRLTNHISEKNNNLNKKCSSFPLLDMPDCKIILVEDYPCERREQLLARESYYIESNECVNKNRPFLTDEQKKQAMQERNHLQKERRAKKNLHRLQTNNNIEPTPNIDLGQSSSARNKERKERLKRINIILQCGRLKTNNQESDLAT